MDKDNNIQKDEKLNEKEPEKLSVDELDGYSGGTISNSKIEENKPIDE